MRGTNTRWIWCCLGVPASSSILTSTSLLQLFSGMLRHCFALKLQKCFVDYNTLHFWVNCSFYVWMVSHFNNQKLSPVARVALVKVFKVTWYCCWAGASILSSLAADHSFPAAANRIQRMCRVRTHLPDWPQHIPFPSSNPLLPQHACVSIVNTSCRDKHVGWESGPRFNLKRATNYWVMRMIPNLSHMIRVWKHDCEISFFYSFIVNGSFNVKLMNWWTMEPRVRWITLIAGWDIPLTIHFCFVTVVESCAGIHPLDCFDFLMQQMHPYNLHHHQNTRLRPYLSKSSLPVFLSTGRGTRIISGTLVDGEQVLLTHAGSAWPLTFHGLWGTSFKHQVKIVHGPQLPRWSRMYCSMSGKMVRALRVWWATLAQRQGFPGYSQGEQVDRLVSEQCSWAKIKTMIPSSGWDRVGGT